MSKNKWIQRVKYIKLNEFATRDWGKEKKKEDELRKQSAYLIDKAIECRDIINSKVLEYIKFNVDENIIKTPNPFSIRIYDMKGEVRKYDDYSLVDDDKILYLKSWGTFLRKNTKYKIDFFLRYYIRIKTEREKVDKTLQADELYHYKMNKYRDFQKRYSEVLDGFDLLYKDIKNSKYNIKLDNIEYDSEFGDILIEFDVNLKEKIVIDKTYNYLDKVNKS